MLAINRQEASAILVAIAAIEADDSELAERLGMSVPTSPRTSANENSVAGGKDAAFFRSDCLNGAIDAPFENDSLL